MNRGHYYTKFIKEYEKEGIPIWGITIQNEPMAVQKMGIICLFQRKKREIFLEKLLESGNEKRRIR